MKTFNFKGLKQIFKIAKYCFGNLFGWLWFCRERSPHKFAPEWENFIEEKILLETDCKNKYTNVFRYLVTGAATYKSKNSSRVYYPGLSSTNTYPVQGFEGFARVAPLMAAWLYHGRDHQISLIHNETFDLLEFLKQGILQGTSLDSPGRWGPVNQCPHMIVETHDIALTFWMLKKSFKGCFTDSESKQIANWLLGVNNFNIYNNNWRLFPCVVNAVLIDLDLGGVEQKMKRNFDKIKEFYLGEGWFKDGCLENIDYYNAWAFQYSLYWLEKINPSFEKEFISDVRKSFIKSYRYLITPAGFPILGRSIIYRFAVSVPFLVSAHHQEISLGEAKRAFDSTWTYFVKEGALLKGVMTQGFFKTNQNLLDDYSCGGSSLWGARSLILAFLFPFDDEFWVCPEEPLAVEKSDFDFVIDKLNWRIKGCKQTGVVEIEKPEGLDASEIVFEKNSRKRKFMILFFKRAKKSLNNSLKYHLKKYSSSKQIQKELFREH